MKKNLRREEAIKKYMKTAHKVNHMLHAKFHKVAIENENEVNVSHEALHVLYIISENDGISIKSICEKNRKSRMLNWKLIKQLEEKELIIKKDNDVDKRKPLHFTTQIGVELVENRTKKIQEILNDVMCDFTDKEIEVLVKLNNKILDSSKK